MDECFSLHDAHNAAVAALRPTGEVDSPKEVVLTDWEDGDGDGEKEQVCCITDMFCNSEHSLFPFNRAESLCKTLSLPVQTPVVEAQKPTKDGICALFYVFRLESRKKQACYFCGYSEELRRTVWWS